MYILKAIHQPEKTINITDMKVGDLAVVVTEDVGTTGHIILRSSRYLVDLTEPENDWGASSERDRHPIQVRLLKPFEKITLEVSEND